MTTQYETALVLKRAVIEATPGDTTIVAAVTNRAIRVLALVVVANGATTLRFESNAAGTALTGQQALADGRSMVLPLHPAGWFQTATGALLNLETSGGTSLGGVLLYIEV